MYESTRSSLIMSLSSFSAIGLDKESIISTSELLREEVTFSAASSRRASDQNVVTSATTGRERRRSDVGVGAEAEEAFTAASSRRGLRSKCRNFRPAGRNVAEGDKVKQRRRAGEAHGREMGTFTAASSRRGFRSKCGNFRPTGEERRRERSRSSGGVERERERVERIRASPRSFSPFTTKCRATSTPDIYSHVRAPPCPSRNIRLFQRRFAYKEGACLISKVTISLSRPLHLLAIRTRCNLLAVPTSSDLSTPCRIGSKARSLLDCEGRLTKKMEKQKEEALYEFVLWYDFSSLFFALFPMFMSYGSLLWELWSSIYPVALSPARPCTDIFDLLVAAFLCHGIL
ncbi:hypothetical protein M5K25_013471 [Dendrobium thyrsiflorum]|uniref:Uncharacterized protein n=1 Tax=Dendrobium thyrsiflorum TaxID=117978 RepID=A0ABD0UZX3_DENTH